MTLTGNNLSNKRLKFIEDTISLCPLIIAKIVSFKYSCHTHPPPNTQKGGATSVK